MLFREERRQKMRMCIVCIPKGEGEERGEEGEADGRQSYGYMMRLRGGIMKVLS
jgi:hypothetical protein